MAIDLDRLQPVPAKFLARDSLVVAPSLLGMVLVSRVGSAEVALRITEVEAYQGVGEDPGSHAFRGQTPRNSTMFGPPGHLYVYRSYGVHWCGNIVTGKQGHAAGILLRAGEIVSGREVAQARRARTGVVRFDRDLARGPGRLGSAMGFGPELDGVPLDDGGLVTLCRPSRRPTTQRVVRSTRTGVAGPGGSLDYRFFLRDDPFVSPHRPAR